MIVSALKSINSLSSLVNMFAGADPVKASLAPLDEFGNPDYGKERAFQYFPEQINDSKSVNYATKRIPGGSHPLYQFINGDDRQISFDAIFTSDEDPTPQSVLDALAGGVDLNLANMITKKISEEKGQKKHTAPVDSGVIWLRSFMYPRYDDSNTVLPPPTAVLFLPNSGIHGAVNNILTLDSINVIMTQCDVTYESFYRGGAQRISVVRLSFYETIQVGDAWKFSNGQAFDDAWYRGEGAVGNIGDSGGKAVPVRPYSVKPTRVPDGPRFKTNPFGVDTGRLI
jgi:hypothetical protein